MTCLLTEIMIIRDNNPDILDTVVFIFAFTYICCALITILIKSKRQKMLLKLRSVLTGEKGKKAIEKSSIVRAIIQVLCVIAVIGAIFLFARISQNRMISCERQKTNEIFASAILEIGTVGQAYAVEQSLGVTTEIFVRLDSVNDENTTKSLIDEYIKSGDAYYTEMEAPLGTHWESVTYSVKADNVNEFYIDTKLIGFDGDKLKYRGIAYSKKTYDILNRTTTNNGWTTGYVSFYAVPNGCKEYAVMFGTDNDGAKYSAYYKVD